MVGAVAAAPVDALRQRRDAARRAHVHDARRIFGVAVDVSSSLIILFTIFGVFLQFSAPASSTSTSRSRRWAASPPAPAAPWCWRRSCSAARRQRRGNDGDAGHGGLADAGQGRATEERGRRPAGRWRPGRDHSPPVLGAAAFLIAEFLNISYLDVLADGVHPDAAVLPRAVPDGGDRRAQVRHARRW